MGRRLQGFRGPAISPMVTGAEDKNSALQQSTGLLGRQRHGRALGTNSSL